MAKPLLLLHHRYTPDDQVIWRVAIKRGWQVERIGSARIDIERKTLGYKFFRYFGNVLHQSEAALHLPIRFPEIDITNLTRIPQLTKRKVELKRAYEIQRPLTERAFYKCPGVKYIESRVYNVGETFECKPDDWVYKQEPINIIDEIRTFVIEGKIQTLSWYRQNKEFLPEFVHDAKILQTLQDLTEKVWNSGKWPKGVVFDFGRLDNSEWCFIEANECWASGLYECSPEACFDTIIASQE